MAETEVAPGVFVFTSALYTTTTTVVAGADGGCLVIDPAIGPGDLAELAGWLTARGLTPVAGWSTHPHWDHVLWSAGLGADVPRYATPTAAAAAAARREALRAEAEAEAPGHDAGLFGRLTAWPGNEIGWDGPEARVVAHDAHAPGHGALFFPSAGVLVAGDMCSDVEIPLVDGESDDPFGTYRAGLGRLAALAGVRAVVPGHGRPAGGAAFRARVAADLEYLDAVAAGAPVTDPRLGKEWLRREHARQVALARRALAPLLQDEDRDETVGLLLVLGVRREGGDGPLPPRGALVAGDLAGGHLPRFGPVPHLDVGVRLQVVVPERVLRRAALGRDRRVAALVLDAHQRRLADLAGLGAPVGDDHDRHAGVEERRSLRAAAALVLFHLVPDPRGRAGLVFTVDSHVPIQHQEALAVFPDLPAFALLAFFGFVSLTVLDAVFGVAAGAAFTGDAFAVAAGPPRFAAAARAVVARVAAGVDVAGVVAAAGIADDMTLAASDSDFTAVSIALVALLMARSALVIVLAESVAWLAAVFSFAAAFVTFVAADETARGVAALAVLVPLALALRRAGFATAVFVGTELPPSQ